MPKQKKQYGTPSSMRYDFYLSGGIGEPEHYVEMFSVIRNCQPDDTVILHINSVGGHLDTAIQFVRVITECEGTVIASVEGNCCSAATLPFLAADMYQISEHSIFMFHNYSGFTGGKGGEMYDQVAFERAWSSNLLHTAYKDFLTTEEINSLLDNKDLWMDADNVLKRLEARLAKSEEENEAVD